MKTYDKNSPYKVLHLGKNLMGPPIGTEQCRGWGQNRAEIDMYGDPQYTPVENRHIHNLLK